MQTPFIRACIHLLLSPVLLLTGSILAWAQQGQQIDPPGRVAYISVQEGAGTLVTDSQDNWAPAVINMPVTTGTRLTSEAGSRTELHGGFSVFRLSGKTNLEVIQLDDNDTRLALTEGTLSARLRELESGEHFEIDTPNMALVASQPGEYRVDVDPRTDTTRLSIHSGSATVYGDAGQAITVNAREQMVFAGRRLQMVSRGGVNFRDAFDQWVSGRDALDDRSASARYVSPATPGLQQLDNYGDWIQDATYGAVWYPRVTVTDWAPYRYGRWTWMDPWGWTWVDDAPWGFAPFHYGRWAQIGPRWAWVPGPRTRRPVYAPALVGFTGGSSGNASWNISVGTAWFPLAPGEYWEPHYRASQRYRHGLNPWDRGQGRPRDGGYHFQRQPQAITAAPPNQFEGRRPRFISGTRVPSNEWAGTHVVPPPSRPRPEPGRHPGQQHPISRDRPDRNPPPVSHDPQRDPQASQIQRQQWEQQRDQQRPPWERQNQSDDRQRQRFEQQRDQQRPPWERQGQTDDRQRQRFERQRDQQRPPWEREQQQNQILEQQRQQREQQQNQVREQQRQQWERQQNLAQEQQRQQREQQQNQAREQQRQQWERQQNQAREQQRQQRDLQQNQAREQQRQRWEQQRDQQRPPWERERPQENRGGEQRRPAPRLHEGFN